MGIAEIMLLAVGVSMDAFAVSICKGLATQKLSLDKMLITGAWFGGFQAMMPVLGYLVGSVFGQYIVAIDHWVAFALLGIIGANMIREALSGENEEVSDCFGVKTMLIMALATSIDAMAIGITFAFLKVNILLSAGVIGVTTFLFSAVGVRIGNVFGARYKGIAELLGGMILIFLGANILREHLGLF